MSFLISDIDSFILENTIPLSSQEEKKKGVSHFKRIEKEEIKKALQSVIEYQGEEAIEVQSTELNVSISFLLLNAFRNMSFVLKATIDNYSRQLHLTYKLLNDHESYTIINSSQKRIFTSKILTFFQRCVPDLFRQFKIFIDTSLGSISIEHPTFFSLNERLDYLGPILSFFTRTFFKGIKEAYQPLLSLIQLSNQNLRAYQKDLISLGEGKRIKRIQKYSKLTSIFLNLGTEQTHEQTSLKYKMFLQGQSLSILNKNFLDVEDQFKSRQLYCLIKDKQNVSDELSDEGDQFTLKQEQKEEIKSKLEILQIKAMLENSERSFVVNHIKLANKINNERLKKIASGGFSNIYLAEVIYYPVSSHTVAKAQPIIRCQPKDIKKRSVILKRETINPLKQVRSRLQHQKEILVRIKSALAIFIPKYYFIYQPTQEEKHDLIIEHIYLHNNTLSLEDYARRFKRSLSQQTIIYFAFMLVQGLRYLKDYQIAHLDIKQGNIMIGKKLAVKIIDFGQSYHPSLKNHRPGVSMPYSPPQSYKMSQEFNSKSDVYSFGVLLYYLLTSRYPFYLYEQKEREQVYRQNLISERWFYTPEGLVDYGQSTVFPYLMKLIGKCMEPDPRNRPELEWISLILREYLEYFR